MIPYSCSCLGQQFAAAVAGAAHTEAPDFVSVGAQFQWDLALVGRHHHCNPLIIRLVRGGVSESARALSNTPTQFGSIGQDPLFAHAKRCAFFCETAHSSPHASLSGDQKQSRLYRKAPVSDPKIDCWTLLCLLDALALPHMRTWAADWSFDQVVPRAQRPCATPQSCFLC